MNVLIDAGAAREMQRVAALNVLGGRSVNSLKSTSNDGE